MGRGNAETANNVLYGKTRSRRLETLSPEAKQILKLLFLVKNDELSYQDVRQQIRNHYPILSDTVLKEILKNMHGDEYIQTRQEGRTRWYQITSKGILRHQHEQSNV